MRLDLQSEMEMGQTGNIEAKRVSRRGEWSKD